MPEGDHEEPSKMTDRPDLEDDAVGEDPESVRQHLRRGGGAFKDAAKASGGLVRNKSHRAGDVGKNAGQSGRDTIDQTYRTVTLQTYRDEVNEALQQVVDVLAAQDAELKHLRARLSELEAHQQTEAEAGVENR